MAANALVQTRIDPAVKERGAAVLEQLGLTVSDAARILATWSESCECCTARSSGPRKNEGSTNGDCFLNVEVEVRVCSDRDQLSAGVASGFQVCIAPCTRIP
jgi:hypothetical protein